MDTKYIIAAAGFAGFVAGTMFQFNTINDLQESNLTARNTNTVLTIEHNKLTDNYESLVEQYANLEVSYIQLLREAESTPDPLPSYISEAPLYDIPLSGALQMYTYDVCQEYGVDYELALAIMWQESNFDAAIISSSGDYGLMQINKCNHERLKKSLGIVDMLDPESNIKAGVYMLSEISKTYNDVNDILMVYNLGPGSAKSKWRNGAHSTEYTKSVAEKYLLVSQNQYPNQL